MKGLEPPRLSTQDPKSCAATNYATSALLKTGAKVFIFWFLRNIIEKNREKKSKKMSL
jgi:hypothetical protein